MSAREVKVSWGGALFKCPVDGCPESGQTISGRCSFHSALASARNLTPEQFDRLRATLATETPLTDEDRRARSARGALATIEWNARDLKRSKRRAKDAGATEGQIATAVRSGKDKA